MGLLSHETDIENQETHIRLSNIPGETEIEDINLTMDPSYSRIR